MAKLFVFLGRSFLKEDDPVVNVFIERLDHYKRLGILEWDHAEESESKSIPDKVRAKLQGKNVFVGIFTRKHYLSALADRRHPATGLSGVWHLLARSEKWATSGWTLQESGFAIAKDMKLILLVEEGVKEIGGLHGAHELIWFDREHLDTARQKFESQIASLIEHPPITESGGEIETALPQTEGAGTDPLRDAQPQAEGDAPNVLAELGEAVGQKDAAKEASILKRWLSEAPSEFERVRRQGMHLWIHLVGGDGDALEQVIALSAKHPAHPFLHMIIGQQMRRLGDLAKAAIHIKQAAVCSDDPEEKAKYFAEASECLVAAKQFREAKALLTSEMPAFTSTPKALSTMLHGLSIVAGAERSVGLQIAFMEGALSNNPMDHTTRFELAKKYADTKNQTMALHHYKILTETEGESGGWNNLGVAYSELGIHGKAVSAYKMAAVHQETLAMGNIAHKLIAAGFQEEAEKEIAKGLAFESCDDHVHGAHRALERNRKEEEAKEKEIIEQARQEQQFRLEFSCALQSAASVHEQIPGTWITPSGEIRLALSGDQIVGAGESSKPEDIFAAALVPGYSGSRRNIVTKLTLKGDLLGNAATGQFTITKGREGEPEPSVFSDGRKTFAVDMLFLPGGKMRALETDAEGKVGITDWHKKA